MRIIRDDTGLEGLRGSIVTLGNFDGIHLGHARILEKVAERASALDLPSVVYTFEPHPVRVVAPGVSLPLITDLEDKSTLIEGFGIDYLVLARFTKEFASKHPREFVEEVVVGKLRAEEVWVGHDYSFGKGRSGTVDYLTELGGELGFEVNVIPAFRIDGEIVSSSRIRELVGEGRVDRAAKLLGRNYRIKGTVVRGRDVGKALGFPTANLEVENELVPAEGVYAAWAVVDGRRMEAVVNIGTAPTFDRGERTVETHLMDFDRDLYGARVALEFAKRLRSERTFESKEALAAQIKKDTAEALEILRKEKAPAGG